MHETFRERQSTFFILLILFDTLGNSLAEVTITVHPANTTICTGEFAVFESEAEGNFSVIPSANIVWKRYITQSGVYKRLETGSEYIIFEGFNVQRIRLTDVLKIKNVTTDDEGWYVLKVGSDVMSNRAYLNVITIADIVPVIFEVTSINSSMFTVYWKSSVVNDNYTVIWTNLHTGVMYNRTVPGNTNSFTVTGLSGGVNYNVSVAAVNRCGIIATSDSVTVYDTYTPDKPTNIRFSPRTSNSFAVQWDEVTDMFPVTYEVSWSDGNGDNGTIATNQTSCTITGLTYDTTYNVTVVAINTCCGAGPTSYTVLTTNTSMSMAPMQPTTTVTITIPLIECMTTTTTTTTITLSPTECIATTSGMVTTILEPIATGGSNGGSDTNTGAIIGTVVGGICGAIAVVVVIAIVIYYCCCGKDSYSVPMQAVAPPYETVQPPAASDKVQMDTNPAYTVPTTGTIKMEENPAYQTITINPGGGGGAGGGVNYYEDIIIDKNVKMTQNPAYAVL
ncbi:fibronectin-like isoform X2 [Dysidea avara]|uniref:fibronectin-like isoform X2 n=1 Tax=Dysidea avara TaxID=196820 RepID=UPI00331DE526